MVSEHSLVEHLGPPPQPITPTQEAAVRRLLAEAFPGGDAPFVGAELGAMLFDETTIGYAPEAASWHPKHAV